MTTVNRVLKCDRCDKDVLVHTIDIINVTLNEELRNLVLDETLFVFKCMNCGNKFKIAYPFLYHDMNNKFMIYHIPSKMKNDIDFKLLSSYSDFDGTHKRIVTDLSVLKEEIHIFENGLSDAVVFAIKFAISETLKKKYDCESINGHFYGLDDSSDSLRFVFFVDHKPIYKKIKLDVYKEILETNFSEQKDIVSKNFICIDEEWFNDITKKVYH